MCIHRNINMFEREQKSLVDCELPPKSSINEEKRMEFCWVVAERKRPHGGLRIPKEFFFSFLFYVLQLKKQSEGKVYAQEPLGKKGGIIK